MILGEGAGVCCLENGRKENALALSGIVCDSSAC
jgi:hypothetical protein